MEKQIVVEKEVVKIEELPVELVEVPTIKKVKKDVQKPPVVQPKAKPVYITINEKEFFKAMEKVKGDIKITNLYEAYNKKSKAFDKHVPSVVKTKIRNFGKKMVLANKIKMKKTKAGFIYKLIKK